MKQVEIVRAYNTIEKLSLVGTLPLKVSYALFKVKNLIKDQIQFQTEKEAEIYKKYSPVRGENGTLQFESSEQANECAEELNKLIAEVSELETDYSDFKKPSISLEEKLDMSVEDVEALAPFIEFIE